MRTRMETEKRITFNFSLPILGFLVFLILLILKVTGVATQVPWFWVYFFLWSPWLLLVALFIILLIILGFITLIESWDDL